MSGLIVIGCGGRGYVASPARLGFLRDAMRERQVRVLFHGGCHRGSHSCPDVVVSADQAWAHVAAGLALQVVACPAPWVQGPVAGPKRNAFMLTLAQSLAPVGGASLEVWALPGRAGTADMVSRARRAGVKVRTFS